MDAPGNQMRRATAIFGAQRLYWDPPASAIFSQHTPLPRRCDQLRAPADSHAVSFRALCANLRGVNGGLRTAVQWISGSCTKIYRFMQCAQHSILFFQSGSRILGLCQRPDHWGEWAERRAVSGAQKLRARGVSISPPRVRSYGCVSI